MHLRTTGFLAIAALVVLSAVPAASAADVVRVCYDGVLYCSNGTESYPFLLCVGHDDGLPGVCIDHSYNPSKTANCKGFYVDAVVVAYHNVECYGDPNCYHYVDNNFPLIGNHGCNVSGAIGFTQLWPYLP